MSGLKSAMNRSFFLFLCVSVFSSFTSAYADEKAKTKSKKISPMTLEGAKTITAADVINLIDKLSDLVIIDSRMDDRPQGYIESSINLADIDTDCDSLAEIIKDHHAPVIFYCNGIKCRRSEKAIKVAASCGYDNIYWYRGGFDDWMKQGYPFITN